MSPKPAPITTQTHSLGHRTKMVKGLPSQNALTHGLASGTLLIYGEDESAYNALLADLFAEWQPATPTENLMVNNMAKHHWLVERALRLQGEILTRPGPHNLSHSFAVLIRYQVTNERAFTRALKALEDLQRARREFVSQKEAEAAKAPANQDPAHHTAHLTKPDYGQIIERGNAACQKTTPETVHRETALPAFTAAPRS